MRAWLRGLRARILVPQDKHIAELYERIHRLEKLVAGTAAARLPGSAEAVRCLPSPAVAVVMPTHNRARFVGEAIQSVIDQRFTDWEMIIVDDGSVDDTEAAVAPFLADKRIRYMRQANAGHSAARNAGIAVTTAPLIAYLDDDNLWYPDFLACAVDLFATDADVDFAYGALVTDLHGLEHSSILWRPFDRERLEEVNFIDTNVMIHRRGLIDRYALWDPTGSGRSMTDWELALELTRTKPAVPLPVFAARYRQCDAERLSLKVAEGAPDQAMPAQ